MNPYNDCTTRAIDGRTEARREDLVKSALWLCGHMATEKNTHDVLQDLYSRYGEGEDADEKIVSALNAEYFKAFFKRKRDEKNREQFADELAARVWETVKNMTWYTDEQKVIPEDLGERVRDKAMGEKKYLAELRVSLCGW